MMLPENFIPTAKLTGKNRYEPKTASEISTFWSSDDD